MSIYEDIQKVTQISQTDENPVIIYTREQNTLRKQKFKKPKPPRNEDLYDTENNVSFNEEYNVIHNEPYICESEITSAIRKANCGINYSNEGIEHQWRIRQAKARLNSNTNTFPHAAAGRNECEILPSENDNLASISNTGTSERNYTEEEESILKKCKLNKNVVIRGLLKHHKISLQDLQMPNDCVDASCSYSTDVQEENMAQQSELCKGSYITSAQLPDNPEDVVHPLLPHGTIDETKYKNIDFTVPHIGKKKKVTARQFFMNIDDSNFNFVKKNITKKNS